MSEGSNPGNGSVTETIVTVQKGQRIAIGSNIVLEITDVRRGQVKISFRAPRHIKIMRKEIIDR